MDKLSLEEIKELRDMRAKFACDWEALAKELPGFPIARDAHLWWVTVNKRMEKPL